MTPAQVAHIMSLLDQYVRACKGVTNYENVMAAKAVRDKLEAALRDAPQQAEPVVAHEREATDVVAQKAANVSDKPQQAEGWGVDANKLLSNAMKPSEIAGPADAQRRRVGELLSWFARLADGQANPKWTTEHAFELAYYIATTPSAPTAVEPDERKPKFCLYCGELVTEPCFDGYCPQRASKGTPL